MTIEFSSVNRHQSFVAYEVAPISANGACGSFSIISSFDRDLNKDDIHEIEIIDNKIFLTENIKSSQHVLEIGNKCINQLILWQLGCYIPNTIALDFSFYEIYKKKGDVELKDVYDQYIQPFLGPSLAIRCSSNLEDGEKQSYAGVFDTYLNVENNFSGFQSYVLKVYEKFCLENDSAIVLSKHDLRIGIMIQKMVQPLFSGFLFTMDPMNPPNRWLKIEYWKGERDKSEDYSITLNIETGKRIRTNKDNVKIHLPVPLQNKLYEVANKLNTYYGFPQDIEFLASKDDDELYLVQSRPITAFSYSPEKVRLDVQDKLKNIFQINYDLYQRETILSSTNISELFVRAIPLGYSIFKYGFAGTHEDQGGISIGRARLGYAKLDFDDQINFFHTIGDQARTNIIVDALTFRLAGIKKEEYLSLFLNYYLEQIKKNPSVALYPEDGLYLQEDTSDLWYEIAGEKGENFRNEYSLFLHHLITHHAPKEYENAIEFFKANNHFYRSHLNQSLVLASNDFLKNEIKQILKYLREEFCPQYVVFARLAFLCTHVAKKKLKKLLQYKTSSFSCEYVLNELLRTITITEELDEANYPYFERLLKAGEISLVEFLDKFQHLGSLDISQPRLGEYSIEELFIIFHQNKKTEYGDVRIRKDDDRIYISADIAALELDKEFEFTKWYEYAGRFMRLREIAKSELLKILYLLKRTKKQVARSYRFSELIHYLEYNEVLDLTAENRDALRLRALHRKAYFETCEQHQVREVLVDFESTPLMKLKLEYEQDIEKQYKFVTGKSIYYGHVEGICLTAKTNDEYLKKLAAYKADKIENIIGVFKGVELSYFNLGVLAGFTTESGGYLSHAATIAREFRIPYITGIKMDQFLDGDYVILDTENEQVIYKR